VPKTIYCWRCRIDVPMLTEEEWQKISPLLNGALKQIKRYRQERNCSIREANSQGFGQEALALYNRISGVKEESLSALHHHRLSIYGQPCKSCGKPLRTLQARFCAMCSAPVAPLIPQPPETPSEA